MTSFNVYTNKKQIYSHLHIGIIPVKNVLNKYFDLVSYSKLRTVTSHNFIN